MRAVVHIGIKAFNQYNLVYSGFIICFSTNVTLECVPVNVRFHMVVKLFGIWERHFAKFALFWNDYDCFGMIP